MKIIGLAIVVLLLTGLVIGSATADYETSDEECSVCGAMPEEIIDYGACNAKCLPYVVASDAAGEPKDKFMVGESLYCYGKRVIPLIPVQLYVVEYQDTWTPRDPLTDVTGGYEQVKPNWCGYFPNTLIWEPVSAEGTYEVVVDTNFDGKWNWWEPRDTVTVTSTEIPEFTSIAVPVVLLLGVMLYMSRKKRNRK